MPACSKSLGKDEKNHCGVLIIAYSEKDRKVCRGKCWFQIAWVHEEGIIVVPQTDCRGTVSWLLGLLYSFKCHGHLEPKFSQFLYLILIPISFDSASLEASVRL